MPNPTAGKSGVLELIQQRAFASLEEKKYSETIRNAFALYMIGTNGEGQAHEIDMLVLMHSTLESIMKDRKKNSTSPRSAAGESACSFCGRGAPIVRLGAGPGVFICNECVDIFHKHFRDEQE